MVRLRELLIIEMERGRICVSIGNRFSKIYERNLIAKQTKNKNINLIQQQQKNKINNLLKINSTNKNKTKIKNDELKQRNINDSTLLIYKAIKMNDKNTKSVNDKSIKINSNEIEEISNIIPIKNREKNLLINESTEMKKNYSINQSLLNSKNLNKLIKENNKNINESKKINNLNKKLAMLEISDLDIFELNETNQKNINFKALSTTISTTLSKKKNLLFVSKQSKKNFKMATFTPLVLTTLKSSSHIIKFNPFTKSLNFIKNNQSKQQNLKTIQSSFNANIPSKKIITTLTTLKRYNLLNNLDY